MEPHKKRSVYRPAPIPDESLQQLEKRFGIGVDKLKQMARELRFGRPKLEMHLLYLDREAKRHS